jgi:hypothetical protein
VPFGRKVHLAPFRRCVSSRSSGMRTCFHIAPNLVSSCLVTTKTGFGRSLINLRLSSAATLSNFLSAWPSNTVALFVKVTVKTRSSKASFPLKVTIVRPPSGDPDADPQEYWLLLCTLYGLQRSPRHWYNKINAILRLIGLTPSLEDPCLYSGYIQDPSDPSGIKLECPLSLGLYVDDFVYFSEDPAVEALFCWLLAEHCKVDFMGIINWFLGVYFSWQLTPSAVTIHLN